MLDSLFNALSPPTALLDGELPEVPEINFASLASSMKII